MTSKEFKERFNYHHHEKCCANCGNGDCLVDGGVECHNPLLDVPDPGDDKAKFPPHKKLQAGELVHKPGCYIFTSEWAVCDNWTAKGEKMETNSMAARCDILTEIKDIANSALTALSLGNYPASFLRDIIRKCDAALAEPPRNCDVGSVQEQRKRFDDFCKKGKLGHMDLSAYCAYDCPCGKSFDCKLAWAQMPHESGMAK